MAGTFELLAIGEADILQSALYFPGGVVDNLAPWGIEVSVSKEAMLTVPAYTQTALFKQSEGAETAVYTESADGEEEIPVSAEAEEWTEEAEGSEELEQETDAGAEAERIQEEQEAVG